MPLLYFFAICKQIELWNLVARRQIPISRDTKEHFSVLVETENCFNVYKPKLQWHYVRENKEHTGTNQLW